MSSIRVLIVDDHDFYRENIISLLEPYPDIEIAGEATGGPDAIAKAEHLRLDIVLMDLRMPDMNGVEATRHIKERLPSARIVILTVSTESLDLLESIKAGASGYVLKDSTIDEVVAAIKAAHAGGAPLEPSVIVSLLAEYTKLAKEEEERHVPVPTMLTPREHEVLECLAEGMNNRAIAHALDISERTVKNHIANVMNKLHMDNRVQLALYAAKHSRPKES